jgi:hypothetical protein
MVKIIIFEPSNNGKVTIPSSYFTNVTKDYHVVVTFGDPGRTNKNSKNR